MLADMLNNKNLNPIIPELFIRGRKLYILIVFIAQSYFSVSKTISLSSTYYFIMNMSNKRELQRTAFHHSSDIGFKGFMNMKPCTEKPYSFLVTDDILELGSPCRTDIKTNHDNS